MPSTITLPAKAPALKAESKNLDFYYGEFKALKGIEMPFSALNSP